MYLEEAIKDAFEGGWFEGLEWGPVESVQILDDNTSFEVKWKSYSWTTDLEGALLNRKFWIALGKTRDWKGNVGSFYEMDMDTWKLYWHRLIDHLTKEGNGFESFFASIAIDREDSPPTSSSPQLSHSISEPVAEQKDHIEVPAQRQKDLPESETSPQQ